MGLRDEMIPVLAESLDLEYEIIDETSRVLKLLEFDGRNNVFKDPPFFTFTAGIKKSYNKFRQKPQFEIYTLEDIGSIVRKVTHVSWNNKVFSIGDGDVDEPDNDRWSWLFFGSITDNVLT